MFIYYPFLFYRKYSRVKLWSLNLSGSKDQIAVLRAVGSISRTRGGINVGGDGIVSDQFIEQIRRVRGPFSLALHLMSVWVLELASKCLSVLCLQEKTKIIYGLLMEVEQLQCYHSLNEILN
jgi:hypothetical protein